MPSGSNTKRRKRFPLATRSRSGGATAGREAKSRRVARGSEVDEALLGCWVKLENKGLSGDIGFLVLQKGLQKKPSANPILTERLILVLLLSKAWPID